MGVLTKSTPSNKEELIAYLNEFEPKISYRAEELLAELTDAIDQPPAEDDEGSFSLDQVPPERTE